MGSESNPKTQTVVDRVHEIADTQADNAPFAHSAPTFDASADTRTCSRTRPYTTRTRYSGCAG